MKSPRLLITLILGTLALWNGAPVHAAPLKPKTFTVSTLLKSGTVGLFNGPCGITSDSQGNLYVADSYNDTIRKIDSNNNVTTIAGGGERTVAFPDGHGQGTNASFQFPTGITSDSQGNLYVADSYNDTIRKMDSNNNVTTIAGRVGVTGNADGQGTNATFNYPSGITSDSHGNIYVADNQTIRKIDSNNYVTTIAGQAGVTGSADGLGTNAIFNYPTGITSDSQGNLYVVDGGNANIRKIDTNLNVTTIAGQTGISVSSDGQGTNATFSINSGWLAGITTDSQGNLYVADNWNIRKIDSNLNVTTIAGGGIWNNPSLDGHGTNATFGSAAGITTDSQGNLYVADQNSDTIRKIDSNNNVTTIAGRTGIKGSSDGPPTNPDYFDPTAIAVDGQGNLFVADNGNKTVWEIATNDAVIPIAGQTGIGVSSDGQGTNATFASVSAIAADNQGNLFVADNQTVRKIDSSSNVTTIAGGGIWYFNSSPDGQGTNAALNFPNSPDVNTRDYRGINVIAPDGHGNLYVADYQAIRKIDSNNNVTTIAGQNDNTGSGGGRSHDGQGTNATFFWLNGIASDGKGNLYVNDNYTIRKIDSNNNVTTIAGRAGIQGSRDAKGTNATFSSVFGITTDNQGNLYVEEDQDVRKIDTNLNVTTIKAQALDAKVSNTDGIGNVFFGLRGITVDSRGNFYISDLSTIREGVFLPLSSQTISFKALPAKAYGDASFNLSSTASSGLPVSYSCHDTDVAVVSGNTVTIVGVGYAYISATQPGSTNFLGASAYQLLKVSKGSQSISLGKIPTQTYASGSTFPLSSTNSSGLAVSYTSSNPKVATVSGSLVTITGAGNTTITASQSGNDNFKAAVPVKQVLTVAKAAQFLMFMTPPIETFVKGNTFSLFAMAMSGSKQPVTFKSSNPGIVSISGTTATMHAAGKVTLTATQAGNGNYLPAVSTAVVTVQ